MSKGNGFIFTMDAIIALVPVFIIVASVSTPGTADSIALQSQFLGDMRKGNDILVSMSAGDAFDTANSSAVNETLGSLIPPNLGYNFTMTYDLNGTETLEIFNLSRGNMSEAESVMEAKQVGLYWTQEIVDDVHMVSHNAFNESASCAGDAESGNATYNMTVYVSSADMAEYDYYFVVDKDDTGSLAAWVQTCQFPFCTPDNDGCEDISWSDITIPKFDSSVSYNMSKYYFSKNYLYPDSVNYVYVKVTGSGEYADFYVMKALKKMDEDFVDPETARNPQVVFVSLKIWREE